MRSFYDSRKIAAEWCGCRSRRSLDVGPEQECSTARPDQEWFINNTGNWIPLQNSSALVENANPIATRLLPMRRRNSPRSRNGRKSCFYLLHWLIKKLRLHVHLLILILLFLVYGSLSLSLYSSYTAALGVTVGVGCLLLILNMLIFAGIYYQRDRSRRKNRLARRSSSEKNVEGRNFSPGDCSGKSHSLLNITNIWSMLPFPDITHRNITGFIDGIHYRVFWGTINSNQITDHGQSKSHKTKWRSKYILNQIAVVLWQHSNATTLNLDVLSK